MRSLIEQLSAMLNRELENVQAFQHILEKEAEVLVAGGKPDILADIVQSKWQRTHALDVLSKERDLLLSTLGWDKGIDALAAENVHIQPLWAELKGAFGRARVLNAENGVLIKTLKKSTEDAMAMIRTARGQNSIYTADGRLSLSRASRVIATT